MLSSAESWYGLNLTHIEMIQEIDINYLRKLLNAHSKTAKESFYLETGKILPRFIIIH